MGFDDLEAAERDRPDKRQDEQPEPEPEPEPERDAGRATSTEPSTVESSVADAESEPTSSASEDEAADSAVSDAPAFEYDDVKQSPLYARPEAWTALEDALDLEVVRALRESGVRNEEKRELHDAVLRVAADHPEEIAEAVREARRED